MSFFYNQKTIDAARSSKSKKQRNIPLKELQKLGCMACPLDADSPSIYETAPNQHKSAVFYAIGESPYSHKSHHSKDVMQFLREKMHPGMHSKTVWDSIIRCPSDETPGDVETNCCHKNIKESIEKRRPWAIVLMGPSPLKYFVGNSDIRLWRGRRFPVTVGSHTCWCYVTMSPDYLNDNPESTKGGAYRESKDDHMFSIDMSKIYADYKNSRKSVEDAPIRYDASDLMEDVVVLNDYSSNGFKRLKKCLEKVKKAKRISIDYETQGLRPYNGEDSILLTCAVCDGNKSYAFPLNHPRGWPPGRRKKVMRLFKQFLLDSGTKIAHNLGMEMEWSGYYMGNSVIDDTEWADTMAQAYVMDQRQRKKGKTLLDLDSLVFRYLGFWPKEHFSGLDKTNMVGEDLDEVLEYNGLDSIVTLLLFEKQLDLLNRKENKRLLDFAYPHHIRTSRTLTKLQLRGIVPDIWVAEQFEDELEFEYDKIMEEMDALPEVKKFARITKKTKFNYNSKKDLDAVFKDILKLPIYSHDESNLLSIPESVTKLPKMIIEARSISNRLDNVGDAIKFRTEDGLLHPNYNDKFTSSGRFSSSEPNLQNYPKHKHKEVRRVIKAPKGHKMLFADYGAVEFRCAAIASRDERLVKSLWSGLDVHMHWAERFIEESDNFLDRVAEEFNLSDEKAIIKQARQESKNNWVFPLIYGANPNSLSGYMKIEKDLAYELSGEFWEDHPGLRDWQKKTVSDYQQNGYVESLVGRRRQGPISYNEIINTSIQGLASDITVDAQNRIDANTDYRQTLNTHDEIGFYIPTNEVEEAVDVIAEIMLFPEFDFINVPLVVEFEWGDNWCDQESLIEISTEDYN